MPTPVLLDTFTATDGTDPTARDMDVYPAGAARWTLDNYGFNAAGVIENNAWTYTPGGGNPGYENFIGLQAEAASPILTAYPYTVFVHATMPTAPTQSLYVSLQSDVNSDPLTGNYLDFQVGAGGNFLGFEQYIRLGDVYLSEYPAFDVGGEHKYAWWCDGSDWAIIADGAIVSQGSASIPLFADLDGMTVNTAGADNSNADRALHAVSVYQGITLAQATSLTAA